VAYNKMGQGKQVKFHFALIREWWGKLHPAALRMLKPSVFIMPPKLMIKNIWAGS